MANNARKINETIIVFCRLWCIHSFY